MCNKEVGSDVHHMQYQKDADSDGFILESERKEVFHKNHLANLMTLCEKCHNELHRTNKKIKRVKTNKGIMISVL